MKKLKLCRRKETKTTENGPIDLLILGEEKDPVHRGGRGNKKPFFITGTEGTTLLREKNVIEALEQHGGLVTHAARSLKCSYRVLRKYLDKNASVQKALDAIKLANVERAERKLRDLVEAGNLGAICFTLKCQGRDRGWIENTDINLPTAPILFKYVPLTTQAAKDK